jgi:hypothetical protein
VFEGKLFVLSFGVEESLNVTFLSLFQQTKIFSSIQMISFNVVCFIFVFWVTGSLIHSQRTERSTDQQTSDLFGINDRSLHSNNRNSFAIGNKESTRLEVHFQTRFPVRFLFIGYKQLMFLLGL